MRKKPERLDLEKPYWKATLREHRAAKEHPVRRKLTDFLGVDLSDVEQHSSQHPVYDLPNLQHGIAACFPDWTLKMTLGQEKHRGFGGVSHVRLEVAPDVWGEYVENGYLLFRVPRRGVRVVMFERLYDEYFGDTYEMTVIAQRKDRKQVELELTKLQAWLEANHYLKGQAIRPDGTLLPRSAQRSWADISLQAPILEAIRANTIGLLNRRETFIRYGVPQKRGILLHGPPGTGKTMIGKILASLDAATFIYATAADCESPSSMRHLFHFGRRLRPTILFLEDLDLFASRRTSQAYTGPLGELLTQMDGLEENDGLIVVATTNDLDAIEPALKDRPSRFDVLLEIGLPEAAERRRIVEQNLPNSDLSETVLDRIAQATDGFSGAQVQELAFLAMQEAVLRHAADDSSQRYVSDVDIERARKRIIGSRNRDAKIGFAYREAQLEFRSHTGSDDTCIPL